MENDNEIEVESEEIIPESQEEVVEEEKPEEGVLLLTQEELCKEVSSTTNVPEDVIKNILTTFRDHHVEVFNL